jgi:hypothetical protein
MLRQRAYTSSVAKRKAQSAQPVKQSAPSPRRAAKKGVRTERTIVRFVFGSSLSSPSFFFISLP